MTRSVWPLLVHLVLPRRVVCSLADGQKPHLRLHLALHANSDSKCKNEKWLVETYLERNIGLTSRLVVFLIVDHALVFSPLNLKPRRPPRLPLPQPRSSPLVLPMLAHGQISGSGTIFSTGSHRLNGLLSTVVHWMPRPERPRLSSTSPGRCRTCTEILQPRVGRVLQLQRRVHRLALLHHERRHVRVNCKKYFVVHAMRTFVVYSFCDTADDTKQSYRMSSSLQTAIQTFLRWFVQPSTFEDPEHRCILQIMQTVLTMLFRRNVYGK